MNEYPLVLKIKLYTWIAGLEVKSKEMPSPSNASIQLPSESIAQSPFDLPNALVCIRDDAVSKGYMIIMLAITLVPKQLI